MPPTLSRILQIIDDDDDMEVIAMAAIFATRKQRRTIKYQYRRLNWDQYTTRLHHTDNISKKQRMSQRGLNRLWKVFSCP